MANDKEDHGQAVYSLIDLSEPYAIRYWTLKFGVSEAQLRKAIEDVGPSAEKVEEWLGKT